MLAFVVRWVIMFLLILSIKVVNMTQYQRDSSVIYKRNNLKVTINFKAKSQKVKVTLYRKLSKSYTVVEELTQVLDLEIYDHLHQQSRFMLKKLRKNLQCKTN